MFSCNVGTLEIEDVIRLEIQPALSFMRYAHGNGKFIYGFDVLRDS